MRDEWQIDCSDHGPGVQWLQHGRNVREFTLLVPGWTVRVRCKQNPTPPPKKTHVTHHSSQNLLDPRNPRGPIQTCEIWTMESMSAHHGGHHNVLHLVCRTHSVFVRLWYLKCWESLNLLNLFGILSGISSHWLNYHHCHCPHWSLIDAHFGRKSM